MNLSNLAHLPEKGFTLFVANANPAWSSNVSTCFEAHVIHSECKDPHLAQHHHVIQSLFNLTNTLWGGWDLYRFTKALLDQHSASLLTKNSALAFLAMATSGIAAVILIRKYNTSPTSAEILNHPSISEEQKDSLSNVNFNRPLSHKLAQYLYAARITLSVGSAFFSTTDKYNFAFNALGATYNLLKLSQIKWLTCERKVQYTTKLFSSIKYVYYTLLLPAQISRFAKEREDQCQLCWRKEGEREDTDPPTYDTSLYFLCTRHLIDIPCLIKKIGSAILTFNPSFDQVQEIKTNGSTRRTYFISIPNKCLPKCDPCTESPPQATLELWVKDFIYGDLNSSLNITSKPVTPSLLATPLADRVSLVYSGFKAALASLQQARFDLFGPVLKMQRICIAFDVALLLRDTAALLENIRNTNDSKAKAPPSKPITSKTIFLSGTAVVLTAGLIAWIGLSRFTAPSADPKGLLVKLLSLPEAEAAKITFQWDSRWIEKLTLWMQLSRLAVNLGSLAFCKNRPSQGLNCALQTLALFKTAQVQWLRMDYKQSLGVPRQLTPFNSTFFFALPAVPSCPDLQNHLTTSLKSVYTAASRFFSESNWTGYWNVTKTNGYVTSRGLHYDVTVKPPRLLSCACHHAPYLDSVGGLAYHIYERVTARIHVTWQTR
jgi:hypothetical protein